MYFDSGIGLERLVLLGVALALIFAFEFVNGFHDTANAGATVIYTRSLKPWPAVVLSGICNFTGVYLGGIAVAMAIIKLLPVELMASSGSAAGLAMVLSLLIAAIIWNVATWYFGLPAPSSHTLLIVSPLFGLVLAGALLRIVVTVGEKIGKTHMSYAQGASAEVVAASTIGATAYLGLPVSTTQVLASGIAGTMVAERSGLQSSTVRNIGLAWLLTLPASVLLAGGLFLGFSAVLPDAPHASARKADLTVTSQDPDATRALQVTSATPLRLRGSNTIGAELMPDLAEAFLAKKNGTAIVRTAGTGPRASWVVSGRLPGQKTPVVFAADEAAKLATSEYVLGLDAVVVIVHPKNPIRSLTLAELGQLFSGEMKRWPREAAAFGEVALYARNEGSTTLELSADSSSAGVRSGRRSASPTMPG